MTLTANARTNGARLVRTIVLDMSSKSEDSGKNKVSSIREGLASGPRYVVLVLFAPVIPAVLSAGRFLEALFAAFCIFFVIFASEMMDSNLLESLFEIASGLQVRQPSQILTSSISTKAMIFCESHTS